jgi:hypothetical protein
MTFCWLDQLRRIVWKELALKGTSLLWKVEYEVSQKKAQICQDTVKYLRYILGFTCHKNNIDLRGNSPFVPFWSPTPINSLENF